jgi:hypothetical protein
MKLALTGPAATGCLIKDMPGLADLVIFVKLKT